MFKKIAFLMNFNEKINQKDFSDALNIFSKLALSLLVFINSLFLLGTLGFLLKISINKYYFFIALVLSISTLIYRNKNHILSLIIFMIILIASVYVANMLYDSSYDGRTYHQLGIYYLVNGWNPVYQKMTDLVALKDFLNIPNELWVEHYLKFSEITASNFVLMFHNIESGKALNYLLSIASFLYGVRILSNIFNFKVAFLVSFLAVFNPVLLAQINTYYVDGLLSSGLLILFLSIIDLEIESSKTKYFIFILAIIMCANIKLTGLAYAGVIGICYFIYRFWRFRFPKGVFLSGIIACLFIILTGINPYITNILENKNPFYPLLGKDKIDIMSYNTPKIFEHLNPAEKLFISLFSKTQNLSQNSPDPVLKIPFTKSGNENYLNTPDMRIGGFGYYFGGILILSILYLVFTFKTFKFKAGKLFLGLLALIIISIGINPESWWARYVPQIWLIPIVIVGYSFYLHQKSFLNILRNVMILFLLLSIFYSFRDGLAASVFYTRGVKNLIAEVKDTHQVIKIYPGENHDSTFLLKFRGGGIRYLLVNKEEYEKNQKDFVIIPYSLGYMSWNFKDK